MNRRERGSLETSMIKARDMAHAMWSHLKLRSLIHGAFPQNDIDGPQVLSQTQVQNIVMPARMCRLARL